MVFLERGPTNLGFTQLHPTVRLQSIYTQFHETLAHNIGVSHHFPHTPARPMAEILWSILSEFVIFAVCCAICSWIHMDTQSKSTQ